MAENPKISNAEWEVMVVLWESGEQMGLSEIIDRLPESQSRNPKTVSTYLTRLAAKDVVSVRKIGRTNLYSANIDQKDCLREQCRDLLCRVFRGATAPMMVSLIEDANLSGDEIDRLQEILDQKREETA